MNIVLWVVAGLLAVVFLASGLMKLLRTPADLKKAGMDWVDLFSPGLVRLVGAVEVLGAIGLVLPALVDVAPVLVPLAATGLALTMAGAAVTHVRMNDYKGIAPSIVLLLLAAFVAWGRFGPYAF